MLILRNLFVKGMLLHFSCLLILLVSKITTIKDEVCSGTMIGLSTTENMTSRLVNLKNRYTNCTDIQGNLELTYIPSEADLDFLQHVREITGYLLIVGVDKPVLDLPSLRIVRGKNLFASDISTDSGEGLYSVFIALNSNLTELGLGQLREISNGTVFMSDNPHLCHVRDTINWNDLLQANGKHLKTGLVADTAHVPGCLPCHSGCGTGYCWGPGKDQCQQLTKTVCAKQCGTHRCRGPGPSDCCHPECAGGCTGPSANECTACRHFANDGQCVEVCPTMQKYDSENFTNVPNPDGKFTYGSICVKECPQNFLKNEQYCVAKCPPGKEEKDRECITCDGPCSKTCSGFARDSRIPWITNITLQQFQNCTVIDGSLAILTQSFTGFADFVGGNFISHPGVELSQMEQLSTIRKITGYLEISGIDANMTDLSFLRNLETIEGRFLVDSGTALRIIRNTHLRSLGLNFLKTIKTGRVKIVGNPKLCYADQIAWNKVLSQSSVFPVPGTSFKPILRKNRNEDECVRAGEKCDSECTNDGCWGPHPDQCLSCASYTYKSVCLSDCAEWNMSNSLALYHAGNNTCAPCHAQCRDGCTGPGESNCTSCLNAKDGPRCVATCSLSKYSDSHKECQPCNKLCTDGCTGLGSFLGEGGCTSCEAGIVSEGPINVMHCLPIDAPCPPRSFQTIAFNETAAVASMIGKKICRPCHPYCTECRDSGVYNCQVCTYFKVDGKCELTCPNATHYIENGTSLCQPCNSGCSIRGCTGPSSTQCESCRSYRDYYDPDRPQSFNCTTQCPAERIYSTNQPSDPHIVLDPSENICTKDDTGSAAKTKKIITGVVVAVVGIIVIAALVVCFRIRKSKIQLEALIIQDKFAGIELAEPLEPTDNKPVTSKLRLISEQELRRSEQLGKGAFGIVYKGFWLPLNEGLRIPVAIRVLEEGVNAEAAKKILDEAHVMASVKHPHLVSLLALCKTSQIMLITQLVPLGSLLDYVKKNKKNITSRTLLNWSSQIAKGMQYLEQRHMIHRDLAARNVLVERPNWVKVTDFGLTRILDCHQESVKSAGGLMPIKWLAPECIDRGVYSHKTDVWAFGVTVWELLSYGLKPFENTPVGELYNILQSGERLPQPVICTLDVYMLLLKCWSSHPESRPCFADLAEDFARMTRDPGRYLVIPGDEYLRQPDHTTEDQLRLFGDMEDLDPEKLVLADDYVGPLAAGFDPQDQHSSPNDPRYTPDPVPFREKRTDTSQPTAEQTFDHVANEYLDPSDGFPETS